MKSTWLPNGVANRVTQASRKKLEEEAVFLTLLCTLCIVAGQTRVCEGVVSIRTVLLSYPYLALVSPHCGMGDQGGTRQETILLAVRDDGSGEEALTWALAEYDRKPRPGISLLYLLLHVVTEVPDESESPSVPLMFHVSCLLRFFF